MSGKRNALPASPKIRLRDRARRVGRVFDHRRRHALDHAAAAARRHRMHVDHRLAPVELVEHRHEGRVAEILVLVAGEQPDAVGLQRVERVLDLLEAAVRVGQRDRGKQAEPALVVAHHAGAVVVDLARELAGRLGLAEPDAGLHRGDDRGLHAALVHVVERLLHRPVGQAAGADLLKRLPLHRGEIVVMHVDARLCGLRARRLARRAGAEPERRDAAGQEIAPAHPGGGRRRIAVAAEAAGEPAREGGHGVSLTLVMRCGVEAARQRDNLPPCRSSLRNAARRARDFSAQAATLRARIRGATLVSQPVGRFSPQRARLSPRAAAGKARDRRHQAARQPARPGARLFAGRRRACEAIAADPREAARLHRARQPRRRGHQRHRGARPRQYRPARRQAGDGGQGGPVQEVRRHRRLRHRGRRAPTSTAGRRRRGARADLRRHQPRGHQGAGMLRGRGAAARRG